MNRNPVSILTAFTDHLNAQYGERGTAAREKFEVAFEAFKRAALRQIPPPKNPR